MKKGDVVTIYEYPVTQEKPEGQAVLLRKVSDGVLYQLGDSEDLYLELWKVRFLGWREEYGPVERSILVARPKTNQNGKR